jgi:hypothetical protein
MSAPRASASNACGHPGCGCSSVGTPASDRRRNYRFIGVAFVVLYVVFVATAGRPYYLAGLYAPLAAAGALGLQRRRETGPSLRRWLIWPGYVLSVALAVGMLILSVTIVRSDVGEQIAQLRVLPAAARRP